MTHDNPAAMRPAFVAAFFALASVGAALSAVAVATPAIRIILIVVALLLLAATGAFLGAALTRPGRSQHN